MNVSEGGHGNIFLSTENVCSDAWNIHVNKTHSYLEEGWTSYYLWKFVRLEATWRQNPKLTLHLCSLICNVCIAVTDTDAYMSIKGFQLDYNPSLLISFKGLTNCQLKKAEFPTPLTHMSSLEISISPMICSTEQFHDGKNNPKNYEAICQQTFRKNHFTIFTFKKLLWY